ncbi:hypothetical protein H6G54_19345 [Anabaena cylindrica FACHB-243]|uniref:Uncharacterized protein n=1 Tax=Anabaena cylindrica (strain ATCC 27899 / PCC 7122) TaxID=272123 RepID=K9ZPN6_ANACC|nr:MULTISPECIES: hypothetical protein [Anabaena]AFZ60744.1 hypothetical protein Anacy_5428 [Anabaena cylindrica PCC 7122]MBD2419821.1 hypothetical protein [Anabaena cylindrica FACHB-243]MBY5281318.1 hypothetical protein [Anabaena sp. CCAP 1446/1C]MBY5309032.1 hypothetical protein [Anabaena sp. CCAP 1446/1C]MCM2406744.1 hypothetical protein [Anabaena sp. CCAP 1446/1C]
MIDLIKAALEFLGKRTWLILCFVVFLPSLLLGFTFFHPFSIKLSTCLQKDSTYILHETIYKVKSIVETSGGASVNLCVKEVIKTVKTGI